VVSRNVFPGAEVAAAAVQLFCKGKRG
jgi:hypothetical protein